MSQQLSNTAAGFQHRSPSSSTRAQWGHVDYAIQYIGMWHVVNPAASVPCQPRHAGNAQPQTASRRHHSSDNYVLEPGTHWHALKPAASPLGQTRHNPLIHATHAQQLVYGRSYTQEASIGNALHG